MGWWRFAAVLISTSMAIAAIGNLLGDLIDEETAQIVLTVVTLTAAALVFGEIAIRRRHPHRGA